MIRVNRIKRECTTICDGCGTGIKQNEDVLEIELDVECCGDMRAYVISLCEKCEEQLRNRLNEIK